MSKIVKIVETGEVFRSVAECAEVLKVSSNAVVHCLKGRRKTVAGCTVVYHPSLFYRHRKYTPRSIIHDDVGRWYLSYSDIARVHHITPAKARTLTIRNNGVFPAKKETTHVTPDLFGPIRFKDKAVPRQ